MSGGAQYRAAIEDNPVLAATILHFWREDSGMSPSRMVNWLMGAHAASTNKAIRDELKMLWEIQMIYAYGEHGLVRPAKKQKAAA